MAFTRRVVCLIPNRRWFVPEANMKDTGDPIAPRNFMQTLLIA
jgi:hypothetical protein